MKRIHFALFCIFMFTSTLLQAFPTDINYQGTLKEKGIPAKGVKVMTFQLVNVDNSVQYSNIISSSLPVSNGLFGAQLSFQLLPGYSWESIKPYLHITVEGQALSPNEPISATIYSLISNSVSDNAITTSKLMDGAVTASKLDPAISGSIIPAGTIVAFAGATAPSGWLLCDGSQVNRTTYANLFSAIGITWGPGNSVTTFNIPDLRGRAPIGSGQGPNLSNRALAQILGEENHTLSIAEMPLHNHGVNDPGHVHVSNGSQYFVGQNSSQNIFGLVAGSSAGSIASTTNNTTGISIQDKGNSQAHNTMPPSVVVNYIIKI